MSYGHARYRNLRKHNPVSDSRKGCSFYAIKGSAMIMKLSSAKSYSFILGIIIPHPPFNRLVTQTRYMHLINAYLPSRAGMFFLCGIFLT